jgi:hypothetical protein
MKHLKSTYQDIRETFSKIQAKHVAENFQSVTPNTASNKVYEDMKNLDFDVMGVKEQDSIIGYIRKNDLRDGVCSDHLKKFEISDLISDSTSIIDFISMLKDRKRFFVLEKNKVTGIITRGDLQKTPIRMHLFGYISLLEMQLQRVIKYKFPEERWFKYLKPKRIEKAKKLLALRKERNEDIGLLECL